MIEIRGLTKRYGVAVAVDRLSTPLRPDGKLTIVSSPTLSTPPRALSGDQNRTGRRRV